MSTASNLKTYTESEAFFQDQNDQNDAFVARINERVESADVSTSTAVNKIPKGDALGNVPGNAATATTMDGIRVRGYRSANYSHTQDAIIQFNTETFDPKSVYNTGTYRCTPGIIGTYLVSAQLKTSVQGSLQIFVNGSRVANIGGYSYSTDYLANISTLVSLTAITDYIEFYFDTTGTITGGSDTSFFDIVRIA